MTQTVSAPLMVPPAAITSSSTLSTPWSVAISTHSTATFRPTATTFRNASATASVREPPPTFGDRERARSSPDRAWVPVTIMAPSFRRISAVEAENSHTPGFENPTTWVTTMRERPVSFGRETQGRYPHPCLRRRSSKPRVRAPVQQRNLRHQPCYPGPDD
jgi:hypothetical protein